MIHWNPVLYSAIKKRRKQYEEECRQARTEGRPIPPYHPIYGGLRRFLILFAILGALLAVDMLFR